MFTQLRLYGYSFTASKKNHPFNVAPRGICTPRSPWLSVMAVAGGWCLRMPKNIHPKSTVLLLMIVKENSAASGFTNGTLNNLLTRRLAECTFLLMLKIVFPQSSASPILRKRALCLMRRIWDCTSIDMYNRCELTMKDWAWGMPMGGTSRRFDARMIWEDAAEIRHKLLQAPRRQSSLSLRLSKDADDWDACVLLYFLSPLLGARERI